MSEGRIRVSHAFRICIRYRAVDDTEPGDQLIEVVRAATILSCCCLPDDTVLPTYHRDAPAVVAVGPEPVQCVCNLGVAELVTRDGEMLRQAQAESAVVGVVAEVEVRERESGVDSSAKSAAVGMRWVRESSVDSRVTPRRSGWADDGKSGV